MSLRHDRELADTLEAEALRRARSDPRHSAALLREAKALRARAASIDRLARKARDLEGGSVSATCPQCGAPTVVAYWKTELLAAKSIEVTTTYRRCENWHYLRPERCIAPARVLPSPP